MTIVEHGKEGYLGQSPTPPQPPFHLGSGSESAIETFKSKQNIKDLKI